MKVRILHLIHACRTHRRHNGIGNPRDDWVRRPFELCGRRERRGGQDEREIDLYGDIGGERRKRKFPEVLHRTRRCGRAFLSSGHDRRREFTVNLRHVEPDRHELFGGKSRLREAQTQSGEVQNLRQERTGTFYERSCLI